MPELLVGEIFGQCARAVPNRVAVVAAGRELTFAELDQRADRLAGWLAPRTEPGDRLVMWTATCVEAAVLFAATAKVGVAYCPLNPDAPEADVVAALATVAPTIVVTDAARVEAARRLVGSSDVAVTDWAQLEAETADPSGFEPPTFDESTPQLMVFTSGTTGEPKAAVISHRAQFLRTHPGALYEPRGMGVCVYPLFHVAPWLIAMQQWHARDGVVFTADTAPATVAEAVRAHQATRLNMIPALWRRLIEHLDGVDPRTGPLASLRFADTGTSATPLSLLREIRALVPDADVRVFYGSTEAGNVCGLEHRHVEDKPGSIGVPSVSNDLRISAAGELQVRSPLLFDGYFGNPNETADAFDGEWYRTGDLAEVDDDGFVSIVGRAKDLIRSGGESIAPVEVEAVLRDLEGLEDVAVVGIPHADWGEVVCAVVVVAAGSQIDLDDLRAQCDGQLAVHKHPRLMHVVDRIPRTTSTGQPQRPLMVELVNAALSQS